MPNFFFDDQAMADLDYVIKLAMAPMERVQRLARNVNQQLDAQQPGAAKQVAAPALPAAPPDQ